jgi:hypothetical protein
MSRPSGTSVVTFTPEISYRASASWPNLSCLIKPSSVLLFGVQPYKLRYGGPSECRSCWSWLLVPCRPGPGWHSQAARVHRDSRQRAARHELDVFRGLLEEAGRRVQDSLPMGVDASHLKDAFTHCEKMRGYAESMLKRLEVNINRSKVTTALKYPFKKKEIEGMLLGVERGKTSLLLANQSFESYVPSSWTLA